MPGHPAPAGDVLNKAEPDEGLLSEEQQTKFRSGVGKLLHMMKWNRPKALNRTREFGSLCATT